MQRSELLEPQELNVEANGADDPHMMGFRRRRYPAALGREQERRRIAAHARQRTEMESRLGALIPPEAEGFGITTSVSAIEGPYVASAILAAAERLAVDVVAVDSHGRSGFKRALLGSVAEEIARNASRPVLLVRSSG